MIEIIPEVTLTREERERSLKGQHKELERGGYDGHNRHSGLTTTRDLHYRKIRRHWRVMLRQTTSSWGK